MNSADLSLQRRVRGRDAGPDDPATGEELPAQDEGARETKQCEAVDLVGKLQVLGGCTQCSLG